MLPNRSALQSPQFYFDYLKACCCIFRPSNSAVNGPGLGTCSTPTCAFCFGSAPTHPCCWPCPCHCCCTPAGEFGIYCGAGLIDGLYGACATGGCPIAAPPCGPGPYCGYCCGDSWA